MNADIIKIICPNPKCSTTLAVEEQPGIENKMVTCPVCKEKSPFKSYKKLNDQSEQTVYPENNVKNKKNNDETEPGLGLNFTLGQLKVGNTTYRLKTGMNIIGRKANSSSADIQIPVSGENKISREHLKIEVEKVQGRGFVHYISLYKQKVNDSFVNNELLKFGDCVILKHGDILKLPNMTLKFEIPDEEGTDF